MTHSLPAGESDFYIEKRVSKTPLQNMHHHRSFELYYMVKGKREYFIEDRFFAVDEGDLVLIPKEVFHRTSGEGGLRYLVHFSDDYLERYFTPVSCRPLLEKMPLVFRGDSLCKQQIQTALERMNLAFSKEEKEQDICLLAGFLYQLLFTAVYGENTYITAEHSDARITGIVQYINENFNTVDDIDQIAEQFYVSKYHLCRFFKKSLGISLISYLNTIKIRQACAMIRDGNFNITEVAMQCGFNSSSYFCKVFKKEVGFSPTEYRLRHKQR